MLLKNYLSTLYWTGQLDWEIFSAWVPAVSITPSQNVLMKTLRVSQYIGLYKNDNVNFFEASFPNAIIGWIDK